jgi:iron uptake system component EfeO
MSKRGERKTSLWRRLGFVLVVGLATTRPMAAFGQADPAEFDAAAAAYKKSAATQIDSLIAGVEDMSTAMQLGDFATARKAWIESHAGWERLEVLTADLFPDLQQGIDGWPRARTGFHAVEIALFAPTPRFPQWETAELLDELYRFRRVFAQSDLTGNFLIAGMATLAYKTSATESGGGESSMSGTSLDDLRHNMEAIDHIWKTTFADAVAAKHKELADSIATRIAGIFALITVPSEDQLDQPTLQQELEQLAAELAKATVALGWRNPNYKSRR